MINPREEYLVNSFSIQMLSEFPCTVKIHEIDRVPEGLISAIGHEDTARVLGVEYNRINIKLQKGDTVYLAQLQGGRLPVGVTELPEGYNFKYYEIQIE